MKCEKCSGKMMIAESKLVTEIGTTDIYNEMKMVCVNPKCLEFAGYDLNKATNYTINRKLVN